MWTTFLVALKANLRNRSALFWMTVFPIVLATMFNGLFGGLAEAYELKPVPMAVIEDTRWQQADGARTFVDALAGETESASDDTTYAEIDQKPADHHHSRHREGGRTTARRRHCQRLSDRRQ